MMWNQGHDPEDFYGIAGKFICPPSPLVYFAGNFLCFLKAITIVSILFRLSHEPSHLLTSL